MTLQTPPGLTPIKTPLLTDCHIHAYALDTENSAKYGNILKRSLIQNLSNGYMTKYHGLNLKSPDFNRLYISNLENEIKQSAYISKGIIFGLDGVYDHKGNLDKNGTTFMITNDYVYDAIRTKKRLKFGASINPMRKDAMDELDKSVSRKAALVKILPNTQGFAPDDHKFNKFKKFYRALAKHKIPLLAHTGYEFALKSINQSYGHPARLRAALDEGVTVIVAHGGATGLVFPELYKKILLEYIRTYPNFYMDISALGIITRTGITRFLRNHEEVLPRLTFATDYPLPVYLFPFYFSLGAKKIKKIQNVDNYFDRYALLMNELGLLAQKPPLRF